MSLLTNETAYRDRRNIMCMSSLPSQKLERKRQKQLLRWLSTSHQSPIRHLHGLNVWSMLVHKNYLADSIVYHVHRQPHLWTYVAPHGKYLSQTYCLNCLLASTGNGFYTWCDIHLSKTEQSAVAPLLTDAHKGNFVVHIFGFYFAVWILLVNKEACWRHP